MAPQPRRAYVPPLGRQKVRPLSNDTPQVDKFKELARELDTDDDEKAFEEKVRAVVKAPKPPEPDK